jgi:hypothetical protein
MGFSDRAYVINGISYWCAPWDVDVIERQHETDFDLQVELRKDWLTVSVSDEAKVLPVDFDSPKEVW